ncbi:MAG: hypothetical protein QM765_35375 [Myxococcales bacterium]
MHSPLRSAAGALLLAATCLVGPATALAAEPETPTATTPASGASGPQVTTTEPGDAPIPVAPAAADSPAPAPPPPLLPPAPKAPDKTEVPFVPKPALRFAFIQEQLDAGQLYARIWWYGWMAGYTALTLGQAIPAGLAKDREDQVNFTVGAITSALSLVATGVMPLRSMYAGDKVRGLAPDPMRLEKAEEILFATAEDERFGRSWLFHVLGAGMGIAAGLVVWLGYGYLVDGFVTALGCVALNEIRDLEPADAGHRRHGGIPAAVRDQGRRHERRDGLPGARRSRVRGGWDVLTAPRHLALIGAAWRRRWNAGFTPLRVIQPSRRLASRPASASAPLRPGGRIWDRPTCRLPAPAHRTPSLLRGT